MASPNYIDQIAEYYTEETITYAERDGEPLNALIITPVTATGAPIGDKNKPLAMIFHPGGGLYNDTGTKNWAKDFACRGYIGMPVEYRPREGDYDYEMQRKTAPAIHCAKRWARFNKKQYGIKAVNIFTHGTSSGGVASIHANLSQNYMDDPYFEDELNRLYTTYQNGEPISNKLRASSSLSGAPNDKFLKFLDASDSEWFDYHGTLDITVPYTEAKKAVEAMQALGIKSTLNGDESSAPGFTRLFDGLTHGNVNNHDAIIADLMPRFAKLMK